VDTNVSSVRNEEPGKCEVWFRHASSSVTTGRVVAEVQLLKRLQCGGGGGVPDRSDLEH
jgi:hypothetical protein